MAGPLSQDTIKKFTTFGDFLRFLRRRAGITQLELSIAVGYSDAQISRLELNLRAPDITTIEARFVPALGLEDEPETVAHLLDLAAKLKREDAPVVGRCPYKGLNFFDEADADYFFGREAITAKIVERVIEIITNPTQEPRFLGIIGASGSGKSSLVRAGIVPALRLNQKTVGWSIYMLTPTAHPLESLALALTVEKNSVGSAAQLIDEMANDSRSLNLFLKKESGYHGTAHSLLVIDQFEEVFVSCHSERERLAFIDNLMQAVEAADGSAAAIITLRADYYARCAGYDRLREGLSRQQEFIGEMTQGDLRRAIEEPALQAHWEIEPGLVDLLLHDVGSEPGALPLLSHALLETWQRRRGRVMTMNGYATSGGVHGAIAETAETVFKDQFNRKQQAITRRIFMRLTELGEETDTIDTRRRVEFSELILDPEQTEDVKSVLKTLADARLVIIGQYAVEVAHEALIREWPTLREWIEENREGFRLHRHLTGAAQEWQTSSRETDLLYRGARLAQAREWALTNNEEMNPLEREFLNESVVYQERETAERERMRQNELEAAQKLAEAERERAEEHAADARQIRKRSTFLAGALTLTLLMVAVALYLGARAREATLAAQEQQRIAFSRELAAAAVNNLEVDPERSILLALEAVSMTYDVDKTWTVDAENALRQALEASRLQLTLHGHTAGVGKAVFSHDGSLVATTSDDGTARIWDAETGREILNLTTGATAFLRAIALSPDGTMVATAGMNNTAILWDVKTGKQLYELTGHTAWVTAMDFSPDGKLLATGSNDRSVIIWDPAAGKKIRIIPAHVAYVFDAKFSPDGTRLATAGNDATVKLWDVKTGAYLLRLSGKYGSAYTLSFNADGSKLVAAHDDGLVRTWDAETGEFLGAFTGNSSDPWAVTFSPDDRLVAAGSADGTIKVWDSSSGLELFTLIGHTMPVTSLTFRSTCWQDFSSETDRCGYYLLSASLDGTARIWNTGVTQELMTLTVPNIDQAVLSADGSLLATGIADGSARIWAISSLLEDAFAGRLFDAEEVTSIDVCCHAGAINDLAFNPDGGLLATASDDHTVKLWDAATGEEIQTLTQHSEAVVKVSFSDDGNVLATMGEDLNLIAWRRTGTGYQLLHSEDADARLDVFDLDNDGDRIAVGLMGFLYVGDIQVTKTYMAARITNGRIWQITFSPDGKLLATASDGQTVDIWEIQTGNRIRTFELGSGQVQSLAFHPDGKILAAGGQGITRLWEVQTGQEITSLPGRPGAVTNISFHPMGVTGDAGLSGMWLATKGTDGTIWFYLTQIEDLVALAKNRVGRTLTAAECVQYLHGSEEECQLKEETVSTGGFEPVRTGSSTPARGLGKICVLTDTSGVHDQFFSQIAYRGATAAAQDHQWDIVVIEPVLAMDYQKDMQQLIEANCDLIAAPHFIDMLEAVIPAIQANRDQKFIIFDFPLDSPLENAWDQIYDPNEAAFLAGYAAASVTKTGKIGTYGGLNIPGVTNFMDGFALGVRYYNERNKTNVEVIGWDVDTREGFFTYNFVSINIGREVAENLLAQGVDVILPVAGLTGLGTAEAARDHGNTYIIGVDDDWAATYPEFSGIVLTSIEKRLDNSVIEAVQAIVDGKFSGGTHIGNLANGGVSLAPFYNLDSLISPAVKADLEEIKADIIAGKIKTLPEGVP